MIAPAMRGCESVSVTRRTLAPPPGSQRPGTVPRLLSAPLCSRCRVVYLRLLFVVQLESALSHIHAVIQPYAQLLIYLYPRVTILRSPLLWYSLALPSVCVCHQQVGLNGRGRYPIRHRRTPEFTGTQGSW